MVLVLAAPPLAFPLQMPAAAWGALVVAGAYCVGDAVRNGLPPWPREFRAAALILFVTIVVGTLRSPATDLSVPKFCSVVLGFLLMWVVARHVTSRQALYSAVAAYIVLGCVVVGIGSSNAIWEWKFAGLDKIAHSLPRGIERLPGMQGGVNANALGATTLLVLPIAGTMLWQLLRTRSRSSSGAGLNPRVLAFGATAGLVAATLASAAILLLTQSRAAWLSLVGTIAIAASVQWRPVRRSLVAFVLLILVGAAVAGLDAPLARMESLLRDLGVAGAHFSVRLDDRFELWGLAMDELRTTPMFGIGLGAFRRTIQNRLPSRLAADGDIAHAHNVYLQTALDVGFVGLAAYGVIICLSLRMAWKTSRSGDPGLMRVALGLGGNVVAVHLFGIVDAVALGAKVGVLMWGSIGLLAAIDGLHGAPRPSGPIPGGQTPR